MDTPAQSSQAILREAFINQLEPAAVFEACRASPPDGFAIDAAADGTPVFEADFDLLTTAEEALQRRVAALPGYRRWKGMLRWKTSFVGTTVSEYALFAAGIDAAAQMRMLKDEFGGRRRLTIIKDIPQDSPLLDAAENAHAERLCEAAVDAGFVLVEGQALAYVPIDFASTAEYLGRLSASRRKDIRRKLRSREELDIEVLPCGSRQFSDAGVIAEFHGLFEQVYAQSKIHFDHPQGAFFARLLADPACGGVVFAYRHAGRLIGWNLCFESNGRLVDKYIGLRYPDARRHNLYAVSWMHNLDHALRRGLGVYVAGWTDPEVKAQLGARFTFTRHAVYARNPLLRALLRRMSGSFERDRAWRASAKSPR